MIRHLPFILFACSILALGTAAGFAATDDQIAAALPVAKAWVAQIDAGLYDDSYLAAGTALHEKFTQNHWDLVLKALRPPWGSVVSRQAVSHVYKPDGFEGTSGEFMVITYATTFKNLDAAREVVVLHLEGGQWRGVGYNAGAKATAQDDGSQSQLQSQTDVESTTEPVNNP
jgi:hypothetical protein